MTPRPLPIIAGVAVDIRALAGIAHDCRPECCAERTSCCATYEVCIERDEQQKILNHIASAASYASAIRDGDDLLDPFDWADGGLTCLQTDEDGLCVFAFDNGSGHTLCSLHAAAMDSGIRPIDAKPRSCHLWPLAVTEPPRPILTVMDDALEFPCNRRRRAGRKNLHAGIAEIVRDAMSDEAVEQINRLLHTDGC